MENKSTWVGIVIPIFLTIWLMGCKKCIEECVDNPNKKEVVIKNRKWEH